MPADATHVREAEPFNARVVPGIAGAVVAAGNRIGAELHQPKRRGGTGKSFAFAKLAARTGANHGIDAIHQRFCRGTKSCCGADKKNAYRDAKAEKLINGKF